MSLFSDCLTSAPAACVCRVETLFCWEATACGTTCLTKRSMPFVNPLSTRDCRAGRWRRKSPALWRSTLRQMLMTSPVFRHFTRVIIASGALVSPCRTLTLVRSVEMIAVDERHREANQTTLLWLLLWFQTTANCRRLMRTQRDESSPLQVAVNTLEAAVIIFLP